MVDIAIIKSNSIIYDVRVRKISRSLAKRYNPLILGWHREDKDINLNNSDLNAPIKLFGLKAPVGKMRLGFYIPIFWFWVFIQLIIYRPKVVHACDLDVIIPSYLYKMLFRKKLVFDLFDRYAMAYIPKKISVLYFIINAVEELFCHHADMLIIVGDNVLTTFKKEPKCYSVIRNCPELSKNNNVIQDNSILTLLYTGGIVRNRGLERITEAMENLDNIELVVAGQVIDKQFFETIIKTPKLKYQGLLQPNDALNLVASAGAMVVLYDLNLPINQIANPNKTFEAMMFGIPLITNVQIQLINDIEYGLVVDYNNIEQIRSAIITLRDNRELRKSLGDKGKKAFMEKYNWGIMEERLFSVYKRLILLCIKS